MFEPKSTILKMKLLSLLLLFVACKGISQTCTVKGFVKDAVNNEPVIFANIFIQESTIGTNTDLEGYYEITGLEPGIYSIEVSYIGYDSAVEQEIELTPNRPTELNFLLEESASQLKEVVVKASAFRKTEESPVSLRNIGVTEIKRRPGGNRDISQVVKSLPGVTSSASFRNDLIIRGGAPNENRFYLDDVEIPNINHFATQGSSGGPNGIINVDFIREVDFYSGAFPANRGNALSSVFQFKQKDGRDDRLGFNATVGASDLGITLEGPIKDKTTFLFSARYSYLQFLFTALELPFLPIYTDFQTKIKFKPSNKEEIYFIGIGAIDDFELNLDANQTETQQFLLSNLPVNTQWNYTNGLVYKRYGDSGSTSFILSRNMLNNQTIKYKDNDESSQENLILDYKSQEIENKFRVETNQRVGDWKYLAGLGTEFVKYNNSTFNKIFTNAGPQDINFQSDIDFWKYYGFAQLSRKFLEDKLIFSVGVRADGNSYSDDMSNPLDQLSPRASISYSVNEQVSLNASAGSFYQLPAYTILGYRENDILVNKENDVSFIKANHFVAGLEWNTSSSARITLEGYLKNYSNYPFLLRDSISIANLGSDFGVIGNEPVVSDAEGRSYGIELLFQQRLFKGYYGILAYTLGWSEFLDGNEYVPTSWDSRHIINLTLGKRFKNNWEAGINWRFQTGLPITPYSDDSSLVLNWDRNNMGIRNFDLINTERQSAFSQVDVRVDKKIFFEKWTLNLYLDVVNATASAVDTETLILDRPLDENNMPIGEGIIENPSDPIPLQRYKLKTIGDNVGIPIPTLGLVISI